MNIELHPAINTIVQTIRGIGGRVFIVGGAVRDLHIGITPDDIDFEVFNVSGKALEGILSTIGHVTVAGKFSIFTFHIDGLKYDFSLPRRDNGEIDPYMSPKAFALLCTDIQNSMMLELPDMFLYDFRNVRYIIDNI
jgi:tRNA nucleotidyltransferase/poly(A) polymerase